MKLQLALDLVDIAGAKEILYSLHDLIDIAEIGTPFIIREGINAVAQIKTDFPDLILLADVKIMDGGDYEAKLAFDAGADIVTVLGAAPDSTILKAVKAARDYDGQIMVDMIAVKDIKTRAKEIVDFGVDYICAHTAFDDQDRGINPAEELRLLRTVVHNAKLAVAGGISIETINIVLPFKPEIIIVGGGITNNKDRRAAAVRLKEVLK